MPASVAAYCVLVVKGAGPVGAAAEAEAGEVGMVGRMDCLVVVAVKLFGCRCGCGFVRISELVGCLR